MKIPRLNSRHRTRQQGSATLVVLALLGFMMIFVTADLAAAHFLDLDLRRIEQRQLQRLHPVQPDKSPASSTSPAHE